MLLTAHYGELKKRPEILEQMYSLRARQFSQRRGWRVVVKDGLEIDIFDDLNPLYICVLDPAGRLIASLMGDAVVVRHPLIWESSRFCVDTEAARQFGSDGINIVTRKILAGLFQTALDAGMQNVISVYDVFVERILKRSGCEFERLGPVVKYDDLKTVGGLFQVSRDVIDAICDEQTLVQAQIVS